MHHVTWLRMRKACELLATTNLKVETVANTVGYQNPFVFSNTFKKWIGACSASSGYFAPAAGGKRRASSPVISRISML